MNRKAISSNLRVFFLLLLTGMTVLQSCSKKESIKPSEDKKPAVISSFSPTSGTKGTIVTITGANFDVDDEARVKFNNVVATVTAATSTSITVIVPEGAGVGKISIAYENQTVTSAENFIYVDDKAPVISSFAPATAAKGTPVTITGTNFSLSAAENHVTFNNIPATVTAATATSLTVVVPQNSTGKISVTYNGVTTISEKDFSYLYTVNTLAGNGTYGYQNGAANIAEFRSPYGLAADAAGNLYVGDSDNNVVRKITAAGVVSTLAGDGTIGNTNGNATVAKFNAPHGMAIDAQGNIYVADAGNNVIRKIAADGIVSTFAGDGTQGLKNGTGIDAEFYFPYSVVLDAQGNLYVTDTGNKCIRKITPDGVVSGFGDKVFAAPEGITIDHAGNLYVADAGGFVIRKVTTNGAISVLAGSGAPGFANGQGALAQFSVPENIAIDASGNLYVSDLGNNMIRLITPAGLVSTAAGDIAHGNKNGPGADARFYGPSGITADAFGNVYVGDIYNSSIRKLQ